MHSFLDIHNLHQYNDIHNINDRFLDLVIASFPCEVLSNEIPLLPVDDYHPPLTIQFETVMSPHRRDTRFVKNVNDKKFRFKNCDFTTFKLSLSNTDWGFLKDIYNVNELIDLFYNKIYELLEKHIGIVTYNHKDNKYPTWYNFKIINSIRIKEKLRRLYKSSGSKHYLIEYQRLRKEIKSEIRKAYSFYLTHVEEEIINNPSTIWTYFNKINKSSRIPRIMSYNDTELNNPQDIVDAFADLFSIVYKPCSIPLRFYPTRYNKLFGDGLLISPEHVFAKLCKLSNKYTAGYDKIPSIVVKECCYELLEPLTIILNRSLNTSTFPDLWKISKICPIFKKGDKSCVKNYRPISILCNFSKVFEMIICDFIWPYFSPELSSAQHGFVPQRSTITNLTSFIQIIESSLVTHNQVDVIFTDISKAFDCIDHAKIITDLQNLGIPDKVLKLLLSFLTNRRMSVQYSGFSSFQFTPTS